MTTQRTNTSSAPAQALGYLAQIDYGLLFLLKQMDDVVDMAVTLETSDDIAFEIIDDSEIVQLWQTKHHLKQGGSLGDSSPDLWKTISNWIDASGGEEFILLTTSTASDGSAARLLSSNPEFRNVSLACSQLQKVAEDGGNESMAPHHRKFLALSPEMRLELLNRVKVFDNAPSSVDISEELLKTTRKSVRDSNRRGLLVENLRGWWHHRVAHHLTEIALNREDKIQLYEVEDKLHYLAQFLRDENLPLSFEIPDEISIEEVEADQRVFVQQLNLIMLHSERIRQAIYNHNRAFNERSKWQREHLLNLDELNTYDRLLIEEWKTFFLPVSGEDISMDEAVKRQKARDSFVRLEQHDLPELRNEMHSGYVPIGSMHMLADELRIGWHPDWVALLQHLLPGAESASIHSGVA